MFLEDEKEIIVDFQLFYDTDSFLHLDFYADGLVKEPKIVINKECVFKKKNMGFVTADKTRYKAYEREFENLLKNPEFINKTKKKMIQSVLDVHRACLRWEKKWRKREIEKKDVKEYYEKITTMMAFKRFSDHCEKKIQKETTRTPSYLMRYIKGLERVRTFPTDKEIQKFINKYGFLQYFGIEKNSAETKNGVLTLIKKNRLPGNKEKRGVTGNQPISLYKYLAWYEELRHYYQLRSLRNFRWLMEENECDLYETSIEDLVNLLTRKEELLCIK